MERALHNAGDRFIKDTEHLHPGWSLEREYPLTPGLLAVSHAWRTGEGAEAIVAAKGAPEAIADLCHLSEDQQQALSRDVATLASQGLRVLGVARGAARIDALPTEHHDLQLELVGLLGLEDPLQPTDEQIAAARRALEERRRKQELARATLAARERPEVRALLDAHFERLGLVDPERHVRLAIGRYPLDAIVDGLAVFDAKRQVGTLPDGADARYLLGIVRNAAAQLEGKALAAKLASAQASTSPQGKGEQVPAAMAERYARAFRLVLQASFANESQIGTWRTTRHVGLRVSHARGPWQRRHDPRL